MALTRYVIEEILNIITHGFGILCGIAALIFGVFKLQQNHYGPWSHAAIWVYGICFILVYTASTVYHSFFRWPKIKQFCRRFDHAAIYLMIAGSYTPFLWISLQEQGGMRWSILIWGIAVVGIVLKLFYAGRFKLFSTLCYLGMGWIAVFFFRDLLAALSFTGLMWLVAGGIAYSVGSIFYLVKSIPYGHVLWHLCVLAGSAAQWYCVQFYVLPTGILS